MCCYASDPDARSDARSEPRSPQTGALLAHSTVCGLSRRRSSSTASEIDACSENAIATAANAATRPKVVHETLSAAPRTNRELPLARFGFPASGPPPFKLMARSRLNASSISLSSPLLASDPDARSDARSEPRSPQTGALLAHSTVCGLSRRRRPQRGIHLGPVHVMSDSAANSKSLIQFVPGTNAVDPGAGAISKRASALAERARPKKIYPTPPPPPVSCTYPSHGGPLVPAAHTKAGDAIEREALAFAARPAWSLR